MFTRRLAGLGYLALLLALVVGIPAALIVFAGNPLVGLPPIAQWFTRRDDGALFLAALTVVGWLAWASMTVSILIEVAAALRGTTAPRLRGLGLQQSFAAMLVAGTLMLFAAHHGAGPAAAAPTSAVADPGSVDPHTTDRAAPRTNPTIVSRPGDSLTTLAAQYLSDAARAGELAAINPQLGDPHTFLPQGTVVTLPVTATTAPRGRAHLTAVRTILAKPGDTFARIAGTELGDSARAGDVEALNPAATARDGTITAGTSINLPAPAAVTSTPTAAAAPAGTLGPIAAAGFLALLILARRRQQHARRRGERIAMPPAAAAATEHAITAAADTDTTAHITRALAHLAAHCDGTSTPLPALFSVTTYGATVTITLAEPAELPAPWHPAGAGRWTVTTTDLPDCVPPQTNPYPALLPTSAPLHHNTDTVAPTILLNLLYLHHLSVTALTADDTTSALRGLAWTLALSPYAADLAITFVGFNPPLPTTTAHHRNVTALTDIRATDPYRPHLIVCAAAPSETEHEYLASPTAPHHTALIDAATPDRHPSWLLRIRDAAAAELVQPHTRWMLPLQPPLISDNDHRTLVEVYATTLAPPAPPARPAAWTADALDQRILDPGTRPATIDLDLTEPDTDVDDLPDVTGHLWIHLLGTPTLTPLAETAPPEQRGPLLTELAVLLSLHPDTGLAHTDIDTALWPSSAIEKEADPTVRAAKKSRRRNETFSRLRKWIGTTSTGEQAFPTVGDRTGNARYRLHPDVISDWDRWNTLITTHPTHTSTCRLTAAANLVHGQPFTTRRRNRYQWAADLQQELIATLTDAIEELAARRHTTGHHTDAERIALLAISIDSAHEGCWRIAVLAANAQGHPDRAQQHLHTLLSELDDLQVDMEDETRTLMRTLAHTPNSADDHRYETIRR